MSLARESSGSVLRKNRSRVVEAMVLLLVAGTLLGGANNAAAEGPFYALIVNGSSSMNVDYNGGYLTVRFRHTTRAAGSPSGYNENVPPGAAAWPDRPLNSNEPAVLRQRMTPQEATAAISRLRQNGGFWKFYCRNTGQGYFEVSRSEPAHASVRFD